MKCVVAIVLALALLLGGCASVSKIVAPQTRQEVLWNTKITIPAEVPDIGEFKILQMMPIQQGETYSIIAIETQGVKNSREFLILVVFVDTRGKEPLPYLLSFQHSIIPEKGDPTSKYYTDETFANTGTFSGIFIETKDFPDLKKFGAMMEQKSKRKVRI